MPCRYRRCRCRSRRLRPRLPGCARSRAGKRRSGRALGDVSAAETRFQRGLHLSQKIGSAAGESASMLALGDLERRRSNNNQADTYFGLALTRARAAGDEGMVVATLLQRGTNEIDRKRYDEALKDATE